VDELRAQVRFGSYRVDADEVAQRMVERGDA
jgi:anti-sigma28 factor (negative regulator of flagellin synthesis)